MPFPSKPLKVLPNPWMYIDHLGRPAGRLPFDGFEHTKTAGFVGASFASVELVKKAMLMRVANRDMEVNPAQHDHRISYSKEPVSIPNTAYYRDAIKRGELIAADKETATTGGIKFVEPSKVLAEAKAVAVAAFDAETAEDAYNRFGAVEPIYIGEESPNPVQSAAKDDK